MPIFLYGVGAVVVAIGAAMIGFGVPNNEFGIGNTLIVAGTTAVTGGLIVIALGVAVAQLQRIVDALATRAPIRSSRPFDTFDPAVAAVARPVATPARVPFPPKTKAETKAEMKAELKAEARPPQPRMEMPRPPAEPFADRLADRLDEYAAPALPNPDEPPVTVADEAFLSPQAEPEHDAPGHDREEDLPPPPAPLRKPKTYFDAMWPADSKPPEQPAEPKLAEPKPVDSKPLEFTPVEFKQAEQQAAEPKAPEFQWSDVRRGESKPAGDIAHSERDEDDAPRAVAILKSGVVDGMGYTLYVDGSIEAELPQGTLRFASINELRSHLEKTS